MNGDPVMEILILACGSPPTLFDYVYDIAMTLGPVSAALSAVAVPVGVLTFRKLLIR